MRALLVREADLWVLLASQPSLMNPELQISEKLSQKKKKKKEVFERAM